MSISPTMMGIESSTLEVNQEIRVRASLENTFAALLEQIGPENESPQGKMPMKIEAWPGGRWFRDLGDGNGHLWGHVQAINHNAGHAKNRCDIEHPAQFVPDLQHPKLFGGAGERCVVDHSRIGCPAFYARDECQVATRYVPTQRFADIGLPSKQRCGQLDRWVEEAVVYGPQLDCDVRSANVPFGCPEAGH